MATIDFSSVPAESLGMLAAAGVKSSVIFPRVQSVPIIGGNRSKLVYIDNPNVRDHNASDSNPKVVDNFTMHQEEIQFTNFYHLSDGEDIDVETNPEVIKAFTSLLPRNFGNKFDRYVFNGKVSGTPTNWNGFTNTAIELVDDASLVDGIDKLNASGYGGANLVYVFDYSVQGVIREALKGDGLGSLTSFNLQGGVNVAGIPLHFTNIGTSVVNNKKTVGALINTDFFRCASGGIKLTSIDTNDGLDDIIRMKARQIAGFTGLQDAAIPFEVSGLSS